jgi:hypothetical protein
MRYIVEDMLKSGSDKLNFLKKPSEKSGASTKVTVATAISYAPFNFT